MKLDTQKLISEFKRINHMNRIWYCVLSLLAFFTIFSTIHFLVAPAITMTPELVCGHENHLHDESCYDGEGGLICFIPEHVHTEECYTHPSGEDDGYVCGYDYEHVHGSECYIGDGILTCSLVEHTHTDECYPVSSLVPEPLPDETDLLSAPLMSMSIDPLAEDVYSSDLSEFITSVTLTDVDGNVIDIHDPSSVVNVGERYRLAIHFDESNDVSNIKQFEYNDEGYLVYDIDDIGLIFDDVHSVGGDITLLYAGTPYVIGHYIFDLDSESGKHIAKVRFDEIDDRGQPNPGTNFIDYVQDAGFGLEIAVTVDADEDDEDLNVNLGASWNVTLKRDTDAGLFVDKVEDGTDVPFESRYPKFDETTHSMLYKLVVRCTKGSVDNISYEDLGTIRVGDLEYSLNDLTNSNYYDFVIKDLDDNVVVTGDSIDCLSAASGPISKGEGYVIYYRMKLDPPAREDLLDQSSAVYATVKNNVTVNYRNPAEPTTPCKPLTDTTTSKISVTNLAKIGGTSASTDAHGNKIINWTVTVGDKEGGLRVPFTVKDTIGAGHSFYSEVTPTWDFIDPLNAVVETGTFLPSEYTVDGNVVYFSLPHDSDNRFRIHYATVTENADGGAYSNTAEVTDKGWTITTTTNVAGGTGSMHKEVTASDNEYLYYTITANIPHNATPIQFYFTDKLYSVNSNNRIANPPEDFRVQVEYYDEIGNKVVADIDEYEKGHTYSDSEMRFYFSPHTGSEPSQRQAWEMYFFRGTPTLFHTTQSKWYYNDYDCVLTISYKIPKSAEVFIAGAPDNLGDLLASGKLVTNEVWFNATYNTTVSYAEPEPTTKRGQIENYSDGTFLYEVAFTNDVIPVGETNPANFLPLCENFINTKFVDTFDEALEYVPDSLTAFVYRRSSSTSAEYIGSTFGIKDSNLTQSPLIQAIFKYTGSGITGNEINAAWDDFVYFKPSSTTEYFHRRYYKEWAIHDYFGKDTAGIHNSTTLEEFANILTNGAGRNDTAVVFVYELKLKDEYKLNELIEIDNEALVKWDLPDSGTYITPTARFDIDYDTSLIDKQMDYQGGDIVSYEIIINPHAMDLTAEDTMIVSDTMCEYLSPYMASLRVFTGTPSSPSPIWGAEIDPNAIYDPVSNTIQMTLPDNIPLKITYNCLINGVEIGEEIFLDNSASINGSPTSVNVNHATVSITASSSTGAGTNHYMYLRKTDDSSHSLNGAVFALYGSKESDKGVPPAGVDAEITYEGQTLYYYSSHETADDSEHIYLHGVFRLDENNDKLESKGLFVLIETVAPEGYDINHTPMAFYWLDAPADPIEGVEVFKHEKDYTFVDSKVSVTLPNTGSNSAIVLNVLAVICFGISAALLTLLVKQKKSRKQQ